VSQKSADLDQLRDELAEISTRLRAVEKDVATLTTELRAHGVTLPRKANPPFGRRPLSPEARRLHYREAAARARAGKAVGKGRGSVSQSAKRKMKQEK
jgi:hypothetical protein